MKKSIFFLAAAITFAGSSAQTRPSFRIDKTFHIASAGGWDYIAVGPDGNLYASHGTQVNIVNKNTGDSVGIILNTNGVHGIAFDAAGGHGFTSNGKANTVTVFDVPTMKRITDIPVGDNPDAIMYEPFSKMIVTCNGRSKDLTLIDPTTNKVTGTIPVGGRPETAVFDGKGMVYVNLEDKNEVVAIDMAGQKAGAHWSLGTGEGPTGLAFDIANKRLFVGCDKVLIVMDSDNGNIIEKVTIGDGCDGVAFDPRLKYIYAANGEGTLSIIHETNAGKFDLVENLPTKKSARTLTLDESTHTVYLPAADMEAAVAGQRPRMVPGTFQILVVNGK